MSKTRIIIFRLATVAISVLATLIALEIVCRIVVHAQLPTPAESTENAAGVDNTRNALGLRERWNEIPGDDRSLRIAFVGDSFTFAAGVEQEQGFVHNVEHLLDPSNEHRVVTLNLGEPGTDPVQQAARLASVCDQLDPDIVVQVVYCNDLGHDLYDELKKIHALQDRRSQLAEFSYLWRFIERRIRGHELRQRTLNYFRGGDSPLMRDQAWRRLERGLRATQSIAQAHGARYRIVLFPWLFELDDYALGDVHRRMRKLAAALHAPFLDLLDVLAGRDAAALRISVIDEHPSIRCHDIVAHAIADWLRNAASDAVQHSTSATGDRSPDS